MLYLTNCLQQPSPRPVQSLLSSEDLQRIDYIQMLYQKRIELGKIVFNEICSFFKILI